MNALMKIAGFSTSGLEESSVEHILHLRATHVLLEHAILYHNGGFSLFLALKCYIFNYMSIKSQLNTSILLLLYYY